MDDDFEFEFPPDPAVAEVPPPPLQTLPMSALSQTPVDQLPRTVAPRAERLSIRQMMRSALTLPAKSAAARRQNVSVGGSGGEYSHAEDAEQRADGSAAEQAASPSEEESSVPRWGLPVPKRRTEWTEGDVRKFYRALSQYGTDFSAISVLYPSFDRHAIKRLYHRELRRYPDRVRAALDNKEEIDVEMFREQLKEKQLKEEPPKKVLAADEEALLREIVEGPREEETDEFAFDDFGDTPAGDVSNNNNTSKKASKKRGRSSPVRTLTEEDNFTLLEMAMRHGEPSAAPPVTKAPEDRYDDMTFTDAALSGRFGSIASPADDDFGFDGL